MPDLVSWGWHRLRDGGEGSPARAGSSCFSALNVFYYVGTNRNPRATKEIFAGNSGMGRRTLLLWGSNLAHASRARSGSQVPAPGLPPAAQSPSRSPATLSWRGRRMPSCGSACRPGYRGGVEAHGEMTSITQVYLPPLASRGEALRQLKNFRRAISTATVRSAGNSIL